jgi:phosphoribosylaminoimidazole-succinocarboxamide synthase
MNLVPKIKIEQITANLEAIDQQIKHAALSTNHNNIRNLIDQRRQLLADLKTEIELEQNQKTTIVDFAYTPNQQITLFINAWCKAKSKAFSGNRFLQSIS